MRQKTIAIIFPNQLFETKYLPFDLSDCSDIYLTEDPIFFSDRERKLSFNMLKLIFQRASMKYYESYLKELGHRVHYLNWTPKVSHLFEHISDKHHTDTKIYVMDPVDHLLESRIIKYGGKFEIEWYDSPLFFSTTENLKEYMTESKYKDKYHQTNFYIWQRQRLNILMDKKGKPFGGKYSYDKENRKSIPGESFEQFLKDNKIKYPERNYDNSFYSEAQKYCEKTFENHYSTNYRPENIHLYPITHKDCRLHFTLFLKYKLKYFGAYQDAIDSNHLSLFHAMISPQLNNGLISPHTILKMILKYYHQQSLATQKKLLFAVEGFIRQLNWREYSRLLYVNEYDKMKSNFFKNKRHLDGRWYDGTTGIEPVDICIKQAFSFGYLHHINRLMVMCNFMNLCQIDPDDVYKWFMEFSLDSYDWVMINNVYSMGMFADGGLTTTKVYISTSSYILKQSNIKPDGYWNVAWKVLYYYFIYRNFDKMDGRSAIYKSQWKSYKDKDSIIKIGAKLVKTLTSK